jgi:acetoacetyl-CoA synthetase
MVEEGDLLWTPDTEWVERSNLVRYMDWLARERDRRFSDYHTLWVWSVTDPEGFWGSLWDFFDVQADSRYDQVLAGHSMLDASWFEGARLNFAEHLLRAEAHTPRKVAIHHVSECRAFAAMSWAELGAQVRAVATALRVMGIEPGDRVVSYMPNIVETTIAMLATTAIGAIWSSVAPEFGLQTILDRVAQIEPKLLFVVDGYRYAGEDHSLISSIDHVIAGLPSLRHVVRLAYMGRGEVPDSDVRTKDWADLLASAAPDREDFRFYRGKADHPLWIVFSSGTTGLPKAIVHGHAGMLLEAYKAIHFSAELTPDSTSFFYSTTAWVVWNTAVSCLLAGGSIVLYDGNPCYPHAGRLWEISEHVQATSIGISPALINRMAKAGVHPRKEFDLSALRFVSLFGAMAPPEVFEWCYAHVKSNLRVVSQAGSTEIASALVGGVLMLPVYAGEIQARMLGMWVDCWDEDGRSVLGEVGELVVRRSFPSMPLGFWGDHDRTRYREAYFEHFPGVWRQGDLLRLNERGGAYIYGRSDATLNRNGIRIGSAEIYRIVLEASDIQDAIAVAVEERGESRILLFVVMASGCSLDFAAKERIAARLRKDASPRHVPDEIVMVPSIPMTSTGKRLEVPLRHILAGKDPALVVDQGAMADPGALRWYTDYARARRALELAAPASD